jgi:hypothetical protein
MSKFMRDFPTASSCFVWPEWQLNRGDVGTHVKLYRIWLNLVSLPSICLKIAVFAEKLRFSPLFEVHKRV